MPEKYSGVKFQVALDKQSPQFSSYESRLADELCYWGRVFARHGMSPEYEHKGSIGSAGNLSFRSIGGFVIKPSGVTLSSLSRHSLVRVFFCDFSQGRVIAQGLRSPSSEACLHSAIYAARPHVNAIFHGHDDAVLKAAKKMNVPATEKEAAYGTAGLAHNALRLLSRHPWSNYFVLKNHGFVSLGATMQEAGQAALDLHEKAVRLAKQKNGKK